MHEILTTLTPCPPWAGFIAGARSLRKPVIQSTLGGFGPAGLATAIHLQNLIERHNAEVERTGAALPGRAPLEVTHGVETNDLRACGGATRAFESRSCANPHV